MNFKFQISNFKFPILILGICLLFFYPILKGHVPFPGDLLVGNSGPYNSKSYSGYAPGAVPHKAQGPDVIRQLYPWKHFVIESIHSGQVPLWNPYNFSGNPLMANFQSAVFYPLNILFLLLPFTLAWTGFIFLTPLLAALFTYLYMREIGVSKVGAVFSGIVFSFSSYMVVWMEYGNIGHTLLWLPLGLFVVEKILKHANRWNFLSLIALLVFSFLGGYIQGYFYIFVVLVYYYIVKAWFYKRLFSRKTIVFFIAISFPVLLTLFQLLPTLELFRFSSRGNYSLETFEKLLNPWWYIITVIAPDFFGHPASRNYWFYGTYIERVSYFGVIPFILAIVALIKACTPHPTLSLRERVKGKHLLSLKGEDKGEGYATLFNLHILIFGFIFIVSFLLSFNILFTKFFYLIPIPVISTTVPTRILCLFVFSGAILAGFGLELLFKKEHRKTLMVACGIVLSILAIGWIVALFGQTLFPNTEWINNLPVSKRNVILPTFYILGLVGMYTLYILKKPSKYLLIAVIFAITLFDLFRFFHKITPFSPTEWIYPQTPVMSYIQQHAGIDRYWGYGSGHIDTNMQMVDHTYSPEGNDPLHIRTYTEFVESSKEGKFPDMLPRPDANIAPGFGQEDLRNNYFRQKVLNALGVKYVLQKDSSLGNDWYFDRATFDDQKYALVFQDAPWQVYENLHATPRAFLTTNYIVVDKDEVIDAFYKQGFNEKTSIILNENPGIKRRMETSPAALLHYSPNEAVFRVRAIHESLLFFSDTYYPGWRATVDEKPEKILLANYAFRAVKVPAGNHTVRFYYEPASFKKGLVLSGVFFVMLIASVLLYPFSLKGRRSG